MDIKYAIRDSVWENYNNSSVLKHNITEESWDLEGILADSGILVSKFHVFYAKYIRDSILNFISDVI